MFWFAAAHRHPHLCISANRPAILSQIPAINQTLYFHGRIYPLPLSLANPPTLRISQSQGLRATSNKNGDMDDEMDDLINKYGEVVYRSKDQKPHAAEVDDDAESLSLAVTLAKVANEIDAIGTRIRDIAEKQFKRVARGDTKPNSWTLLDFGDVVVHIFLPQQREFYNLEEFYGNATLIELPFNTESTSFRE